MTTTLQWVLSEPSLLVSMSVVCILPGLTGWQPQVSSYLSDTVGASCILSEGLWEARVGRWTVSLIRGALGGGRGGKDRDSRYECARALLWWRIRCCLTISVSRTEPLVFMTVPSCTQARGIERECVCVCVLVCVCVHACAVRLELVDKWGHQWFMSIKYAAAQPIENSQHLFLFFSPHHSDGFNPFILTSLLSPSFPVAPPFNRSSPSFPSLMSCLLPLPPKLQRSAYSDPARWSPQDECSHGATGAIRHMIHIHTLKHILCVAYRRLASIQRPMFGWLNSC